MQTFDVAFQSRIHVALHYEDLNVDAKRKIWIGFMKKARQNSSTLSSPTGGLSEEHLQFLCNKNLNGRQIKNAVRTASAIADSEGKQMSYEHLTQVLEIVDQFDLT